jgi:hypothetical protein
METCSLKKYKNDNVNRLILEIKLMFFYLLLQKKRDHTTL